MYPLQDTVLLIVVTSSSNLLPMGRSTILFTKVLCPAGQAYFRIWNDGRVQGCPNLPGVAALYDGGNIKERRITIQPAPFQCNTPKYCDCHVIEALGKMGNAITGD